MTSRPGDLQAIQDWVVEYGAQGADVALLLGETSERLLSAGMPLMRTHLSFPTLDPLKRSENIVWLRGKGTEREFLVHEDFEEAYQRSPFPEMLRTGQNTRRWRLRGPADAEGFPVIAQMQAAGATDLIVRLTPFGGNIGALVGTAISAATDAPDGFSPEDVVSLTAIVPVMGLAAYRIVLADVTERVLGAYIGHDAGRHVLSGQIRAGEGNQVSGALLLADLQGFTTATEREGSGMIGRLGEHLQAIAGPVEAEGGEVLKFLGDGLLAAFPVMGEPGSACDQALAAARRALALNDAVNARHPPETALGLDVALHFGEVFYGNIGAGSRLEFTVIGPAVNEAARLETLCGTLQQPLLLSESFAARCSAPSRSLGRHALRGVSGEQEVFVPEREES